MITINLKGRLGNQMFQYTVCRSLAYKNGYNYYIHGGKELWETFPTLNRGIIDGQIKTILYAHNDIIYDNIYNCEDFTHLEGYYPNESWFDYNEKNIKEWFKIELNDEEEEIANNILKKYNSDDYCYVHFRGSDYKSLNWFLPKEYYQTAFLKFPNKKFLIITDDIEEAKKYFPNLDIIKNEMKIDLFLFTKCKSIILSNSTFCWWGAWLNDNNEEKIAPYGWFSYPNVDINTNFVKKFKYIKHI